MKKAPFYLINSLKNDMPVVVSIPHSGTFLPKQMKEKLLDDVILPNMDWHLSEFYSFLGDMGFTVIVNNMSRYVIDVNRSLIDYNGKSYKSNLIYTYTTMDAPMYKILPDSKEIDARITKYYTPYHEAIQNALKYKREHFETVYLIDLHSFGMNAGVDAVLGNAHGKSCSQKCFDFWKTGLHGKGYRVGENDPFSGGYITKEYGAKNNCQSIQIELWYQAYIAHREFGNEELPTIDTMLFNKVQQDLRNIFWDFVEWLKPSTKSK